MAQQVRAWTRTAEVPARPSATACQVGNRCCRNLRAVHRHDDGRPGTAAARMSGGGPSTGEFASSTIVISAARSVSVGLGHDRQLDVAPPPLWSRASGNGEQAINETLLLSCRLLFRHGEHVKVAPRPQSAEDGRPKEIRAHCMGPENVAHQSNDTIELLLVRVAHQREDATMAWTRDAGQVRLLCSAKTKSPPKRSPRWFLRRRRPKRTQLHPGESPPYQFEAPRAVAAQGSCALPLRSGPEIEGHRARPRSSSLSLPRLIDSNFGRGRGRGCRATSQGIADVRGLLEPGLRARFLRSLDLDHHCKELPFR